MSLRLDAESDLYATPNMIIAHFEFIADIGLEVFEVYTMVDDDKSEAILEGDTANV